MLRTECPNPQFSREGITILNGKWKFYSPSVPDASEIEVPFAPESVLSGINRTDFINDCEYTRTFTAEKPSGGERLFIRFGAVNYEATVFINGKRVGVHRGGYTPFGFDISKAVESGENEIRVLVHNDVTENIPTGKQSAKRESFGCFYTRVTGIWQPVWLERTPENYVKSLRFFPDIGKGSVGVEIVGEGEGDAEITVTYDGKPAGEAKGYVKYRKRFEIALGEKHLWEIGNGRLYDVTVRYCGDEVKSYFGLREVRYDGMKFLLNGVSVFQRLSLDQGYYPDGLYTAPDDESMIRDVELGLRLGFNGARLHQKVFDPRFLYHCDKAGYMVWGEFPSWGVDYENLEALGTVAGEWTEAVERDFNHPSIVTWCPLNETWESLIDPRKVRDVRFVDAIYALTKALDETRPCVDVSGGFHGHKTDLYDFHDYLDPETLEKHLKALDEKDELIMDKVYAPDFADEDGLRYEKGLPLNASEYGGVSYATSSENGWGYRRCGGEQEYVDGYVRLTSLLLKAKKLSGFCYTQLYDVEQEQNGLYTYDRKSKFSETAERQIRECNMQKAAIEDCTQSETAMNNQDNFGAGFVVPATSDRFEKRKIY